ncbi:MAG: GAF domain-containing sensor histidine kinase [Ktedonobacterales bacterium]|nr:GAF domain-containing sensor histidine kinase [Ktedonobacterales bacterium]
MAQQPKGATRTRELRRRNRELSILNTIASALNRSVDLGEALRTTLAQVADLLDLRTGWVWLLDEETDESYLAAAQNLPPALARNPGRMAGWCYCLDTYRSGDLSGAANVNVVTCSRLKSLVDGTDGLRYHASIPLYAHEKRLGVMNLASPDWRELSPDDLRLLHTVGDLLSIAIERARLFARGAQLGAVEERNRLAREIHDTLAQGMAGVALRLEAADALLDANALPDADGAREAVREAVRTALALTRANLEEARRSVLDLRAAPLEGRTLAQALAALAREWSTRGGGPRISFTATGGSRPLPVRIEVGLYRITQEALANIFQHAVARHAEIRLVTTPAVVRCLIADDGQGFAPDTLPPGRFGLLGMRERAKLLGGSLRVASGPGQGARVEAIIPLEAS